MLAKTLICRSFNDWAEARFAGGGRSRRQVKFPSCPYSVALFALAIPASGQSAPPAKPVPPQNAPSPLPPTCAEVHRGAYGPYRANNDLLYYHLDIRVDPAAKTIAGQNAVRFKMLEDGSRIQLDLTETLQINKITFGEEALKYSRDSGAVFIDFPRALKSGRTYSVDVYYWGLPDRRVASAGCPTETDPAGRPWIFTAVDAFEHYFGEYPFARDGYKLVQVPYSGMEQQSAVSYGNDFVNGYHARGT